VELHKLRNPKSVRFAPLNIPVFGSWLISCNDFDSFCAWKYLMNLFSDTLLKQC